MSVSAKKVVRRGGTLTVFFASCPAGSTQFVLRIKNNVFVPKNDICLDKNGLRKLFLIASPTVSIGTVRSGGDNMSFL